VLDPNSRTVDPELLMESLFKVTQLETRFNMNLNVLNNHGAPQVMNLKEILESFLEHRMDVLVRRSEFRLDQIARRLEILDGLLIAYLNLDELIRIIRTEDHPKPIIMKKWDLSDMQAEAILNMRLRNLRKLEEFEIKGEHKDLSVEQKELKALLKSEEKRWQHIGDEIRDMKNNFGARIALGKRRTFFDEPPAGKVIDIEAFVEKEPITILYSNMGWLKALKGHTDDVSDVKYKEGDEGRFLLHAQTTDKLLMLGTDGRFYTLPCDKIPRGKGFGDPVRLMIGLPAEEEIVNMAIFQTGEKFLIASSAGKGFIVESDDVMAQTKNGKQVLGLSAGSKAAVMVPAAGDHVAVIGSNRKMLVFPISQLPPMKKGQGVMLQKYKGAQLADAVVFTLKEGLSWSLGSKMRTESNVKPWLGNRADMGKLPPTGFPRTNKF
ncbi:MAG: DNA gyrase subunit A, partial [Alphaproteobacteria bacterium]